MCPFHSLTRLPAPQGLTAETAIWIHTVKPLLTISTAYCPQPTVFLLLTHLSTSGCVLPGREPASLWARRFPKNKKGVEITAGKLKSALDAEASVF